MPKINRAPSLEARFDLINDGVKEKLIVGKSLEEHRTDRHAFFMNKAEATESVQLRRPFGHLENPRKYEGGYKKYFVYCKDSGEILAYFYSKEPSLKDPVDFHYICWLDSKSWHGCETVNYNPDNKEYNFISVNGVPTKKEPRVTFGDVKLKRGQLIGKSKAKNALRYVEYVIKEVARDTEIIKFLKDV